MRCRGSFSLTNRSCVAVWTLLLAALACRDTSSPTGPEPSPRLTASAATLSFQQVSAGGFHACGVTSAGQAYCWGDNDFGALGTGSNTGPEACSGAGGPFPCSTRPVLVVGGHQFHQVSVGIAAHLRGHDRLPGLSAGGPTIGASLAMALPPHDPSRLWSPADSGSVRSMPAIPTPVR